MSGRISHLGQQPLCLPDQALAIGLGNIVVPGDPKKIQAHIEWNTCGHAIKYTPGIWEMTAILAKEITDKRFRPALACRCDHECMLQFASNTPDVERPVSPPHPFKIDDTHPEAFPEKEIARGGITMQPDLRTLPHVRTVLPPAPEQAELGHVRALDPATPQEPVNYAVEVVAFRTEIDILVI